MNTCMYIPYKIHVHVQQRIFTKIHIITEYLAVKNLKTTQTLLQLLVNNSIIHYNYNTLIHYAYNKRVSVCVCVEGELAFEE